MPGGVGGAPYTKPITQGEIARGGQIESPRPLMLPKFPISGSKWNAKQIARMPVNDLAQRVDAGELPPVRSLLLDMSDQEPNVLEEMADEVKEYFKYVLKEDEQDDRDEDSDQYLKKWLKQQRKRVLKRRARSDDMTQYLQDVNQKWRMAQPSKPGAKAYRAVKNPGKPGTPPAARSL
jgi:hypothetical protein